MASIERCDDRRVRRDAGCDRIGRQLGRRRPTAPPPVTILTHGNVGNGDFFISPFGDADDVCQRSRDPRPERQRRLVPAGPGRRGGRRLPHADLPRPAGADLVAGHRRSAASPTVPTTSTTSQYQQIATVNAGQRPQRRRPRVPDHPQNTALILGLHDNDGRPHLDRRPRRPDDHRRGRPGDRHPDRQGPVPMEQRRPRSLLAERAAAAGLGEHAVGLVPHQRGQARHRRQPADRRP